MLNNLGLHVMLLTQPTDRVIAFDGQELLQSIALFVNVVILIFILYKLLYNPVLKVLKDRQKRIARQLEDASNNFKKYEDLKIDYEAKIKGVDKERSEILENARRRALEKEEQILEEAKAEAETIKTRALSEIEREKDKQQDEIKKQIVEVSTILASKIVQKNLDEETSNKLLNEVIADLGGIEWQN